MNRNANMNEQTRREFLRVGISVGGALISGVGLQGCVSTLERRTQKSDSEVLRFRFAHVTDMHVSTKGKNGAAMKADSVRIFEDVIAQLNATDGLDFVLFGGDNFDNSEKGVADLDKFLELTGRLDVPYYIQFGNREASSLPPGDPVSKKEFVKKFQGHGFGGNSFWWSVSPIKGVTVLGLDTSIDGRNNGIIPKKQLRWIKKEIASHRDDFVMVLTHHLFLPTWRPKTIPKWDKNYVIGNSAEVMPILEDSPNVKLVLSGHHHVTKVQVRRGLPYIASPATVQYPHAFRIVSVKGNQASLNFYQIRDKDIISSGKANLIKSKSQEYGKSDSGNVADYCMGDSKDRITALRLR